MMDDFEIGTERILVTRDWYHERMFSGETPIDLKNGQEFYTTMFVPATKAESGIAFFWTTVGVPVPEYITERVYERR